MAKFRTKPREVEAGQYHNVPNGWPEGVCAGCDLAFVVGPHVHSSDDSATALTEGAWVVREQDGEHFIVIEDDVFQEHYEPARVCVEIDLAGTLLVQANMDLLHRKIEAAVFSGEVDMEVDVTLKRCATVGGVPRLIVDRGQIYDALVQLIQERQR